MDGGYCKFDTTLYGITNDRDIGITALARFDDRSHPNHSITVFPREDTRVDIFISV